MQIRSHCTINVCKPNLLAYIWAWLLGAERQRERERWTPEWGQLCKPMKASSKHDKVSAFKANPIWVLPSNSPPCIKFVPLCKSRALSLQLELVFLSLFPLPWKKWDFYWKVSSFNWKGISLFILGKLSDLEFSFFFPSLSRCLSWVFWVFLWLFSLLYESSFHFCFF